MQFFCPEYANSGQIHIGRFGGRAREAGPKGARIVSSRHPRWPSWLGTSGLAHNVVSYGPPFRRGPLERPFEAADRTKSHGKGRGRPFQDTVGVWRPPPSSSSSRASWLRHIAEVRVGPVSMNGLSGSHSTGISSGCILHILMDSENDLNHSRALIKSCILNRMNAFSI